MHPPAAASREPSQIPVLETARLRLRPYRLSDLDPLAAMWGDPEHVRFIGNRTRPRSEVFVSLQRHIGSWFLVGYGFWVLESLDDHAVVGEAGFLPGMRAMDPGIDDTPEAGWSIGKAHWGQGLATEALQACLGWCDRELPFARTACIIEHGHDASVRVATKCGYTKAMDSTLGESPVGVYQRPQCASGLPHEAQ